MVDRDGRQDDQVGYLTGERGRIDHSQRDRTRLIIDHIGLAVTDYGRSKAFFTSALAPLRAGMIMEVDQLNLSGNCLAIAPASTSAMTYMWSFIAFQVIASC